jgi:hypothetical protein
MNMQRTGSRPISGSTFEQHLGSFCTVSFEFLGVGYIFWFCSCVRDAIDTATAAAAAAAAACDCALRVLSQWDLRDAIAGVSAVHLLTSSISNDASESVFILHNERASADLLFHV